MADASGQAHDVGGAQAMKVDFQGWKEIVLDADAAAPGKSLKGPHHQFDFPLYTQITLTLRSPGHDAEGDIYLDDIAVDSESSAQATLNCEIAVVSPQYCAEVAGDTTVAVSAPAFKTLTVKCWQQGEGFGHDATVAAVTLDARGQGSFVFPADKYPHGPLAVRILGDNGYVEDRCNLQLYNKGGVSWNEGIPKDAPPAAAGMKLLFADDFSGPLSISRSDPKATYYSHKAPNGSQDFSAHTFSDLESPKNPFLQVDTYLRIRASDKLHSSGLISSIHNDGSGITAKVPCYFECRFIGPSAPGAWPAWWLMTDYITGPKGQGCDELDVIEAYGGNGPGRPNFDDGFMITPHRWGQGKPGNDMATKAFHEMHNPDHFQRAGIPFSWYEGFHTYGCKITDTDTIYYVDNIEVARHETFPCSKTQPIFFFINLATGGGWPVDLSRYHGLADMYVDFVRVYQGEAAPTTQPTSP
jgi:hypothetical protein